MLFSLLSLGPSDLGVLVSLLSKLFLITCLENNPNLWAVIGEFVRLYQSAQQDLQLQQGKPANNKNVFSVDVKSGSFTSTLTNTKTPLPLI